MKFKLHPNFMQLCNIRVKQCFLGFGTTLAAMPHANDDPASLIVGVAARVGNEPPVPNRSEFSRFITFVGDMIDLVPEFRTPCEYPDGVMDLFQWFISVANYTESRKADLTELWISLNDGIWLRAEYTTNSTFAKLEWYIEPKVVRGIYSRHDVFKCLSGALIKMVENDAFKRPEFIKKIALAERPEHIMKIEFDDSELFKVGMNDYTSYESHFTPDLFEACEFQLYERKLRKNFGPIWDFIKSVYSGTNILKNKAFTGSLSARRMSGEMNTSLGNGFTNLMITWYMLHKSGISKSDLVSKLYCVVEGDDSLFAANSKIDWQTYEKLGITAKPELHKRIGDASFCGMIFDEQDRTIIADISKVVIGLGWGDRKYACARDAKKLALLRAKALSGAFQYRGCPILDVLFHRILELTRSIDHRDAMRRMGDDNTYKKEIFDLAATDGKMLIAMGPAEPGFRTRLLVEERFGISVTMQQYIELASKDMTLGFNDVLALIATDHQIEYARNHVRCVTRDVLSCGLPQRQGLISPEQFNACRRCFDERDQAIFRAASVR